MLQVLVSTRLRSRKMGSEILTIVLIEEWAYIRYPPSILAVSAFKCGLMHLDFDDLNETVDIACSLTSVCQVSIYRLCISKDDLSTYNLIVVPRNRFVLVLK
jgi:hypothetical protein